jgi:hypothetical protein
MDGAWEAGVGVVRLEITRPPDPGWRVMDVFLSGSGRPEDF